MAWVRDWPRTGRPPSVQAQTNEYMLRAPGHASIRPLNPPGGSPVAVANNARLQEERDTACEERDHWVERYALSKRKCGQYKESADRLSVQIEEENQLVVAQRQNYEQKLARLDSQLEEEKALLKLETGPLGRKKALEAQHKWHKQKLTSQLEEGKALAAAQQQSYEQELARLGSQLGEEKALLEKEEALAAVQRQSYEQELKRPNSPRTCSVDAGLEPVSDQELDAIIRNLQDQVPAPPTPSACNVLYWVLL